ncbi:hypothetical protein OsJ_02077 [Oryza sativa Japonica Group]|uniref:Katanin p80 subunit C-terminal domain-containing protein n=1 Tax=Oryza sativa subsp. japonica TaxID=39947 RepID=B9EXB7_ORYSJ|nr:hypothetical protein OsJ_02077 [Oryza sativa Japonica Group]
MMTGATPPSQQRTLSRRSSRTWGHTTRWLAATAEPSQAYEKDLSTIDEAMIPIDLMQSHDEFINAVKSRLTKLEGTNLAYLCMIDYTYEEALLSLAPAVYAAVPARLRNHRTVAEAMTDRRWIQDIQFGVGYSSDPRVFQALGLPSMMRHVFDQNGIKGAIAAVAKLPDNAVQADVVSTLKRKLDLFSLDIFLSFLPVLAGLLTSKAERHAIVSLELLLDLIKIFGPVIRSTLSAHSAVGVDIQAEQRRGGQSAQLAQELNLSLHDLVVI